MYKQDEAADVLPSTLWELPFAHRLSANLSAQFLNLGPPA
jgi:hypothetical protein